MEPNVNYAIVGTFVITLICAIVLSIIWLSAGLSFERNIIYMIYMQESVTGLNTESPVEYNGVEVGQVISIKLNHQNPRWVELLLSIKKDTPITVDTVASRASRGITGITYVALRDKGTNTTPLVKRLGQRYPIIKTEPSLLLRLDIALSRLAKNFRQITEALQNVLDKENLQSIKETLANLRQVTHTIAMNNERLNIILENTSKATQQLPPLMQASREAMQMLQVQTLPTAYRVLANLDDMSVTLTQVTEEIRKNPSVLVRGTGQPQLGPGEMR